MRFRSTHAAGTALGLALALVSSSILAQEKDPPKTPPEPTPEKQAAPGGNDIAGEAPFNEAVAVTAELDGVTAGPLGASTTVVSPNEGGGAPSALTDLVVEIAGVSENGQGGLFQNFSIRGVSRQRVTSLVSGMKITSERRAGPSTSFIDPLLMSSVEVLRGPSTTFYGSGALGGVVQVFPRRYRGFALDTGFDSDGDETHLAAGVGGDRWSVGLAQRSAGDSEAADGTRLHTEFTQYSAVMSRDWGEGPRRWELLFVPTLAEDIGKSNTDFPERRTDYPLERHQLVKLSVQSDRNWRAHLFLHHQDLDTLVIREDGRRNRVANESLDWGLRWERKLDAGPTGLHVGLEAFGRQDVDASEVATDAAGDSTTLEPLDGAQEIEAGAFAAIDWSWGRSTWKAGTRASWITQDNAGFTADDRSDFNVYTGASRPLGSRGLELRGNLSTGLRFPSLSELFFSGTTGRGGVIGNPGLDEETSLSGEVGLRWLGGVTLVDLVLFRTEVDDYIERVEITPDLVTFVNLQSGDIEGVELQGLTSLAGGWKLSWGGHLIDGEASDGTPLADVPPDELHVGLERRRDRWGARTRVSWRNEKDDPGSGEKAIPSVTLWAVTLDFAVSRQWTVAVGGHNLLDEEYFRSADDKAPLANGRSASIRLIRTGLP